MKGEKHQNLTNLFSRARREIIRGRKFRDLKRVARRVHFRESTVKTREREYIYVGCVHIHRRARHYACDVRQYLLCQRLTVIQ